MRVGEGSLHVVSRGLSTLRDYPGRAKQDAQRKNMEKKRGPKPPVSLGRAGRSVDAQRIGYAEAVSLTSLVPHVAGVKVAVH
jgi:hypothetical protein